LLDEFCGPRFVEGLGVGGLVVVGGVGVGDEDGGQSGEGNFREGGCSGAGDHEIGDGVGGGHLVAEADELVTGALDGMLRLDAGEVVRAGDVEDLDVFREERGGVGDELVEAERALRAAGDEEGGLGGIEPEAFGGLGAGGKLVDFRAGGGACEEGGLFEKRGGRLQSDEDLVAEAGGEHVGAAGAGVGIVDEGLFSELVSGVNGRQRGEAAHAEHGVGSELADDFFRGLDRLVERQEEGQHLRGESRGLRDGGDDTEIQVRVFRGGLGIDFLLGNEQQRLVALGEEGFGDGDAGKQVAAGAAAGDEDFHK
jgi:hypothetical protein